MPLIHFQQRFAEAVANGTKQQTIRKARKRPIKPGDRLILGTWIGMPYRSKVRRLREVRCKRVDKIAIGQFGSMIVNGRSLGWRRRSSLATADGFSCGRDMVEWFRQVHGLPFHGVIIRW